MATSARSTSTRGSSAADALRSYSINTAAELLEVSARTVERLIARGELRTFRIGKRGLRIREADLHTFVERQMAAAPGVEDA